jgi:excisionase family DNA binding protein
MTDNEAELTPTEGETTPAGELPQVLTAQEVADLLRVSYKIITTLAKAGEIPAFIVAGQWRFLKNDVESWLLAMSRRDYKGPELPGRENYGDV